MDKLFVDDNALALYYASLEGRVDALEEDGGGGSSLPDVTASDNGKVLTVSSGKWAAKAAPTGLPSVSSSDNGKVLAVANGAWSKQNVPTELPAVTATDNGNVLTVVEGQWQKAEPFGGGNVMIVEMIYDDPQDPQASRSSKTVAEVKNAIENGILPLFKMNYTYYDEYEHTTNIDIQYEAFKYFTCSGTEGNLSYELAFTNNSITAYPNDVYFHYVGD